MYQATYGIHPYCLKHISTGTNCSTMYMASMSTQTQIMCVNNLQLAAIIYSRIMYTGTPVIVLYTMYRLVALNASFSLAMAISRKLHWLRCIFQDCGFPAYNRKRKYSSWLSPKTMDFQYETNSSFAKH